MASSSHYNLDAEIDETFNQCFDETFDQIFDQTFEDVVGDQQNEENPRKTRIFIERNREEGHHQL